MNNPQPHKPKVKPRKLKHPLKLNPHLPFPLLCLSSSITNLHFRISPHHPTSSSSVPTPRIESYVVIKCWDRVDSSCPEGGKEKVSIFLAMDSDYHQRYEQLFQENQHHHGHQQQQQQGQIGSGLTRFRSAPSSFFANLLDRDFCEDILNRPSSPETEGILVRLMFGGSGGGDGESPLPQRVDEPEMKAEDQDFVPSQQQGQRYYQRQSGSSQQHQQLPDVGNRDSGFSGTSLVGMDRFGQAKQGSSLTRHSSSPAGLFADINIDESGFVSMDNMRGDYGSRLGNNQLNYSSSRPQPPLLSSSSSMGHHMSPIAEEKAFVRDHQESEFGPEYRVAPWEDAVSVSENFSLFDRNHEFKASDNEVGRSRPPLGLSHHLSLPKSSVDLSAIDKFLQMQDSVPCKIRAKRGFATHPRSIAERVRRTKISERMRKLQDLVPNMDKQTNTADMLDLAVDYVKELQKQVKVLSSQRARCTCSNGLLRSN